MAWSNTITRAGAALLAQWLPGGTLTIDGAKAGTGTVAASALADSTGMAGDSHDLAIAGYKIDAAQQTTTFNVALRAAESAYTAMQIGIWGHIGSGSSTLISIYQAGSGEGIAVPAAADMPSFLTVVAAALAVAVGGTLSVTVDTTVAVTHGELDVALAKKLDAFSELEALETPMQNDDEVAVGRDGVGYKTTADELALALNKFGRTVSADNYVGPNVNPFTLAPGVYAVANMSHNTDYWPRADIIGTLVINASGAYKTAIIIDGVFLFYARDPSSASVFTWRHAVRDNGDTMSGRLAIDVPHATPMRFKQTGGGGSQVDIIGFTESERTQFGVRQYTPNGAYYEDFYLPSTTPSDTATKGHVIITDKNLGNVFTTSSSPSTANDNPSDYNAGVYRLSNGGFNTSYWPIAAIYGVMVVMQNHVDPHKTALIICDGGGANSRMFFGWMNTNADTVFKWEEVNTSPMIYREYAFNETVAAGSQLHKRIDSTGSAGIVISGYTIIGAHVKMTSTNVQACTVTANTYNDAQLFIHILNQGAQSATITGTVRVAYMKN